MERTSEKGRKAIKTHEALRLFAYPDPASKLARATHNMRLGWGFKPARGILAKLNPEIAALDGGPWTCGYGETSGVTPDTQWTEQQANARFDQTLSKFEQGVAKALTVPATPGQFDAMVSLAYNIGLGWEGPKKPPGAKDGFRQSSVLRLHNRGDTAGAARAFRLWNKAGGVVNNGLDVRRGEESAMYSRSSPPDVIPGTNLPQVPSSNVDPETRMTESPINRAAVIAGGSTTVAGVAEVARTAADAKYSMQQLGDWLLPLILVAVVVGLCGYIVWQRKKQRDGGWA